MRSISKLALMALATAAPSVLQAGWPFTADGPRRGTAEWYEIHSGDPVGQRQRFKFGKSWPAGVSRPIGEPAPLVHKFHHNVAWPHPYVDMDRQSIKQVEQMQVANGWEQSTTLYDYHFEPETNELNSSGRKHLMWIATSVPPEFRVVFVQQSLLIPESNPVRISSVQSALASAQMQLPVMPRIATPPGTPAVDVDAVFQYRRDNLTPSPVLQGSSGGGGGGGAVQ
ncbi:MAG: hypothetical protein ACK5Q5_04130 [Planctomycetaceae bacterium]